MARRPWYEVITPRQDLRAGRPLDASEFAVHLDQVREGHAPDDYQDPARFFERTYLTRSLLGLAAEVVRRLSGIRVETSAVFNMATQFGGGKTHALALLYHLAGAGSRAAEWQGVPKILEQAGVPAVPQAAVAVFVGQQFDPRGGDDGTPRRETPWGEIAFQLGGVESFQKIAQLDADGIAPGGDTVRRILPSDRPVLILMDELMNYIGRYRKSGLAGQFYNFLQNLSETVRGLDNAVLAVSVPASELEMGTDDYADYERFKKMLDRIGKAVVMSSEAETSEIIRRRLFEWEGLPPEGRQTAAEYARWLQDRRHHVPTWFPVDHAEEIFAVSYPFHPMTLSVFERKWQALPRFQRTRGILRLLALWISRAYIDGFMKGLHGEPLITLGTAPLDDPLFRAAIFEQLGSSELEGAVTTDIAGKKESHALRLDTDAVDTIRKARLHQKVATAVFLESNGGQTAAPAEATVPELGLALAGPGMDAENVLTAVEALANTCYFLVGEHGQYHFSVTPGLNKIYADRHATIRTDQVRERVRETVRRVFNTGRGLRPHCFPEKSSDIPNQPVLTLVVMAPDQADGDPTTQQLIGKMTREYGASSRTFKSALIWIVADDVGRMMDEARKLLAWADIESDRDRLGLDAVQQKQVQENRRRADQDLTESVWRAYRKVLLLGRNNEWKEIDLGLVHSSAAESLVTLILNRLRQDDEVTEKVSPTLLVRNWPTMTVWNTRSVREAFYSSPQLPRLLDPEALRGTIVQGVERGQLAYVGPVGSDGKYTPFYFGESTGLCEADIEFGDDTFVIPAEEAQKQIEVPRLARLEVRPFAVQLKPGESCSLSAQGFDQYDRPLPVSGVYWEAQGCRVGPSGVVIADAPEGRYTVSARVKGLEAMAEVIVAEEPVQVSPTPPVQPTQLTGGLVWEGKVPPQKWMNFYTRVLAPFVTQAGLKLTVRFDVTEGISRQKVDEIRIVLRELGLDEQALRIVGDEATK
jgi:hypothetical protein